ncbi:MAG: hypothetical protein OEU26_22710 [Candidatus Tectomicrobia bacterium]|nr:hypothetical protein [Candidatus Tectomicrobia bacterium]
MRTPLLLAAMMNQLLLLVSCTATLPTLPSVPSPPEPSSFETANASLSYARIGEATRVWQDKQSTPFDQALAAFRLAQETSNSSWSREAIGQFKALRKADSNKHAQAYLGASHALAARNFPLQGWWMIIPGPGFVRLYHVQRAFFHLNTAVEIAPTEPIARLIRAATLTSMSNMFGGHDQGMVDFALINRWVTRDELNPEHQLIVASPRYQEEFWLSYARALDRLDRPGEALTYWRHLLQAQSNPGIVKLAQWRLATGG